MFDGRLARADPFDPLVAPDAAVPLLVDPLLVDPLPLVPACAERPLPVVPLPVVTLPVVPFGEGWSLVVRLPFVPLRGRLGWAPGS